MSDLCTFHSHKKVLVLLWTSPHLSSRASLSLECLRRALQPVLESEWVTNSLR